MKSPYTDKDMKIVREYRNLKFRNDDFKVLFHAYRCEDTGEQFEDKAFAELNYNQLVNQYREKYSILFPEQIRSIRQKYNLSAVKMSDVLGFGTNVYRQYEAGEVPSQSNAKLIKLADDPHEFRKLVQICPGLEPAPKSKVLKTIESLLEEQRQNKVEKQLELYFFGTCEPGSYTGYRVPNFTKLTEMILYFTECLSPWKTKLNKLLFYADFTMHKESGFSISGVQYQAIPMGPVPLNFNALYEYMTNKGILEANFTHFSDGGVGEQYKPCKNRKFDKSIFTEQELKVLEAIAGRFNTTTTREIIDISHQEKAWIDNQAERKIIDYNYSFELKQA